MCGLVAAETLVLSYSRANFKRFFFKAIFIWTFGLFSRKRGKKNKYLFCRWFTI